MIISMNKIYKHFKNNLIIASVLFMFSSQKTPKKKEKVIHFGEGGLNKIKKITQRIAQKQRKSCFFLLS